MSEPQHARPGRDEEPHPGPAPGDQLTSRRARPGRTARTRAGLPKTPPGPLPQAAPGPVQATPPPAPADDHTASSSPGRHAAPGALPDLNAFLEAGLRVGYSHAYHGEPYPGPPAYPANYEEYKKEFESYDGIPMPWSRNPGASYADDYAHELAYERYMEEKDLEFFRFQARDQAGVAASWVAAWPAVRPSSPAQPWMKGCIRSRSLALAGLPASASIIAVMAWFRVTRRPGR